MMQSIEPDISLVSWRLNVEARRKLTIEAVMARLDQGSSPRVREQLDAALAETVERLQKSEDELGHLIQLTRG